MSEKGNQIEKTANNERKKRKDIYIYNFALIQFFLDHGICPEAIGRGNRGEVFLKFNRTEAVEEVLSKWEAYVEKVKSKEDAFS